MVSLCMSVRQMLRQSCYSTLTKQVVPCPGCDKNGQLCFASPLACCNIATFEVELGSATSCATLSSPNEQASSGYHVPMLCSALQLNEKWSCLRARCDTEKQSKSVKKHQIMIFSRKMVSRSHLCQKDLCVCVSVVRLGPKSASAKRAHSCSSHSRYSVMAR